jgi:hypothetical protein
MLTPEVLTRLYDEIEERLTRAPARLNAHRYDSDVVRAPVDEVRSTIHKMVDSGLETRNSWFT